MAFAAGPQSESIASKPLKETGWVWLCHKLWYSSSYQCSLNRHLLYLCIWICWANGKIVSGQIVLNLSNGFSNQNNLLSQSFRRVKGTKHSVLNENNPWNKCFLWNLFWGTVSCWGTCAFIRSLKQLFVMHSIQKLRNPHMAQTCGQQYSDVKHVLQVFTKRKITQMKHMLTRHVWLYLFSLLSEDLTGSFGLSRLEKTQTIWTFTPSHTTYIRKRGCKPLTLTRWNDFSQWKETTGRKVEYSNRTPAWRQD